MISEVMEEDVDLDFQCNLIKTGTGAVGSNMFLESNASWIPGTYVCSSIPGTYLGSSTPGT